MSDNEAKPETQNGEEKSDHVHVSVATQVRLSCAFVFASLALERLCVKTTHAQDGKKLTFKVRWQAPLQKVFHAFCSRMSLNQDEVVFLHGNERLRNTQTLEEVGVI